jgi:ribose/xylose/arabinose/galactoside ABC-type transport system permease subunit
MQETAKRNAFMHRLMGENQTLRLLIITLVIFAGFSLVLGDKFFSIRNLQSMAVQFPEFGILAFAIMITMLTGGIDLSIVGTANLSAIAAALVLTRLSGEGGARHAAGSLDPAGDGGGVGRGFGVRSVQRLPWSPRWASRRFWQRWAPARSTLGFPT